MTDRISTLTVALQPGIRDDDAEGIAEAIRHLSGVAGVTMTVDDGWVARTQVRSELYTEILEAVAKVLL